MAEGIPTSVVHCKHLASGYCAVCAWELLSELQTAKCHLQGFFVVNLSMVARHEILYGHKGWYAVTSKPTAEKGQIIVFLYLGEVVRIGEVEQVVQPGVLHEDSMFMEWYQVVYTTIKDKDNGVK